ncbi:glycoside hydrolase family 172 protein [Sphingobacterium thalpophilum]|uniref:Glycoside hydrolase family 172 protein n=1 Tax=Sphingobacterium thalpophilum TaxID=259 RepID=A0A4U9U850_9SPHI|nr:glycoside hydrolase family 172 protein [Sphingobacterium thalpophilum]VTR29255.1 Protein of uncharacterised function (DUF2961) [Sphingobacterium thalpophilum]
MRRLVFLWCIFLFGYTSSAQQFNGLSNLSKLSTAKSRSISPENFTGAKGKGGMAVPNEKDSPRNQANASRAARELGIGWKVNPYVHIGAGETFTLAEIDGSGVIQHIWMTPTGNWSQSIIRFYWDGETEPSVEAPVGAFFGMGWNRFAPLNSLMMTVNPGSAFNSYWPMPFRKKCRITMENVSIHPMVLYYQVNYAETQVGDDEAYFHAQYRRSNPTEGSLHTILDGVKGKGHYVGTYLAVGVNNTGWWGEGEVKFFLDGDKEFATIVTTGLEDYFCGSYNFENKETRRYQEFSTPYAGLHQVIRPDGIYDSQQRFGMYRWHIADPVRFEGDLKVTVQDLGWRSEDRYLPQKSDMISVAYWYQTEPHGKFKPLPGKNGIEIN